ncbi:hypothetical protein PoB_001091500 [Plakobranchus ocellatus]|uniref:Uncharacterized protein n=1 Tax=Plakobranchus ocellatus TaxID=259542 RepID=A0AAV3YMT9_9GAST|nr:hypothetical protein PoB_001091500 [Plakobranchus ocellatus]
MRIVRQNTTKEWEENCILFPPTTTTITTPQTHTRLLLLLPSKSSSMISCPGEMQSSIPICRSGPRPVILLHDNGTLSDIPVIPGPPT